MKRWTAIILVMAVIALVGGAAYVGVQTGQEKKPTVAQEPPTVPVTRGDVEQSVIAPGQVVGTREVSLGMGTAGQIASLSVRAGDTVKAGDELAQLDPEPLRKALLVAQSKLARAQTDHSRRLAEARLQLEIAEANLAKARARAPAAGGEPKETPAAVRAAESRLVQARNSLWSAQSQRDSVCGQGKGSACVAAEAAVLNGEEAVRLAELQLKQEVDKAQTDDLATRLDLTILAAQVEQARINLERLGEGLDPALGREVEAAQSALEGATLRAPFDGTVLEVSAREGETVAAGRPILTLSSPTVVEVQSTVIEEDLPLVQVGQPVELHFDARPDVTVQGRVARIVPQRVPGDRPLYPVHIAIDEPPAGVLPGMTADSSIVVAQRQNVLRLPRALVRAGEGGTAQVRVWTNGQQEKRAVKVGLRGDMYVEILEGLREGEKVVSG